MNRWQITALVLILCVLLWIVIHPTVNHTPKGIAKYKKKFLRRLSPFYSNISVESRLSHLEDAVFNERTKEPLAYLRTFEHPFLLNVPKSWCLSSTKAKRNITYRKRDIQAHRLSEAAIETLVNTCFKEKDLSAPIRMKLRHILRLLRNSFEKHNVTLIMTFGSMLGSLRYHQRMHYDVDYDFFLHAGDMQKAMDILANLSANTTGEMRLIDARPSHGLPKFGFLCSNDPDWRKREKECIEKKGSYLECKSMAATNAVIKTCFFYADLYWIVKDDNRYLRVNSVRTKFDVNDVLNSNYRPLDGTIFRSVRNFERYAEMIYGSSTQVCVPKVKRLLANEELSKCINETNIDCEYFEVPCEYIDKRRPRIYILENGRNTIELGLQWLKSGECAVHSLFVKFKRRTLFI